MRTVAVVCAYWPQRRWNVDRIVMDLMTGSVVPDHIIILNNNQAEPLTPETQLAIDSGVCSVVNPTMNTECRGKFVTALYDVADYYLMMDDDTSVGVRTLETLLHWAVDGMRSGGEFVSGYWGVQIRNDRQGRASFMEGNIVFPDQIHAPIQVDAFHGRGMFMSFGALVNMLQLEKLVRLGKDAYPNEGDDLLAGLANPTYSWMVPMRNSAAFVDLDPGEEAMQNRPGYFAMRDEFLRHVLEVRTAA